MREGTFSDAEGERRELGMRRVGADALEPVVVEELRRELDDGCVRPVVVAQHDPQGEIRRVPVVEPFQQRNLHAERHGYIDDDDIDVSVFSLPPILFALCKTMGTCSFLLV